MRSLRRERRLPGAMRERRCKRAASGEAKRGASLPTSWYNCGAWCKIGSTLGPPPRDRPEAVGEGSPQLPLVSHLEDLAMSTTRGVLYVHSAPSALCPHIEWAVGGVFGMPVRVDWIVQPIERACYRTEYSWAGPCGTAARLASALKGWQRIRFEVTEEATSGTEGERYSYTPALGMFHAITGIHGDIMIPEDRIKHAMALSALGNKDLTAALHDLLGSTWDEELEPFRYAGDGAPVRWLHEVV
jgi:Protein of unknown function (DUF3145)